MTETKRRNKRINISYDGEDELSKRRAKIKKKKNKRKVLIAFIIIVAAIVAISVFFALLNRTYSSYSIDSSVSRESDDGTEFVAYKGGYLKYSSSGISYVDKSGTDCWNVAYSMQSPHISIRDDNIVVGDVNGNDIYMFDESGQTGSVKTEYQISQVKAAGKGVAEAVMKTESNSYVNLYNKDGTTIYSIKTTISGDGYPVATSVSNDSSKLEVSYMKTEGDSVKSSLVFYDFSSDGNRFENRVSGGFNNFNNEIIGEVAFLSNSKAIAVSENSLHYYNIGSTPSESEIINIEQNINDVFYSEGYVGLITDNDDESNPYRLMIFNANGGRLCDVPMKTQYSSYKFDGDSVIMYGEKEFAVMNLSGKFITQQTTEDKISAFIAGGSRTTYYLVNDNFIQKIKLS